MYVDMDIISPYLLKHRLSSLSNNIFQIPNITFTTSIVTHIQVISDLIGAKESLDKLEELKKIKLDIIPLEQDIMSNAIEIIKKHDFPAHTAIHVATAVKIGEEMLSFNRKVEGIPGVKRKDPYIFLADNTRPGFDEKFKSIKF